MPRLGRSAQRGRLRGLLTLFWVLSTDGGEPVTATDEEYKRKKKVRDAQKAARKAATKAMQEQEQRAKHQKSK